MLEENLDDYIQNFDAYRNGPAVERVKLNESGKLGSLLRTIDPWIDGSAA